jgi:DNA-directed RNA polymerase specialized sigma24 family protein
LNEFERLLLEVRDRPDGFTAFVRETRHVWQRFARYLCRRWAPPLGVDEEDVVQELLLAGWHHLRKWDPDRGTPIDRFVRFNAIDKAKKWLHQQRNSYRRDGSAPSRVPTVFSAFERPDEDAGSAQDRIAWVPPEQDEALAARDFRRQMALAFEELAPVLPFREREVLSAVALNAGDLEAAADTIIADRALCLAIRVGSDDEAALVVRRSVSRAVDIIAAKQSNGGPTQ